MVTFGGADKMAKSVGNVLDVGRAVDLHGRNAVRMWLLQSHYSQPIEYSEEILEEKRRSYERLLRLYRQISDSKTSSGLSDELAAGLRKRLEEAMREDLNTPEVVAMLFEAANRAAREISISDQAEAVDEFASLAGAIEEVMTVFGFDLTRGMATEVGGVRIRYSEEPGEEILALAANRELARRERDWATADRLRDELAEAGWAVEDTPDGPILSRR
jgi:cysteinyl-tRNA synthetase